MKTSHRYLLLLTALLACAIPALSNVPQVINYQGRLTQPSGAPVADATYSMLFSIYDVPTGGTALWSETQSSVQVKGGLFATLLGSSTPFPSDIFDSPTRYFAVKVGSDPEMSPRQQVASSAFSFRSGVSSAVDDGAISTTKIVDGAVTAGKLATGVAIPPGGVILWSGAADTIPTGWALCDGSNGTPNLRDKFIVGAGSAYAVGATGGEATHTLTQAEMPVHNHTSGPFMQHSAVPTSDWCVRGTDPYIYGAVYLDVSPLTSNAGSGGAHENRPPYYALCYIMKLAY